jgi:hypothetical protein
MFFENYGVELLLNVVTIDSAVKKQSWYIIVFWKRLFLFWKSETEFSDFRVVSPLTRNIEFNLVE